MAKIFKKLYIVNPAVSVNSDNTRWFRKLSTFVINGTYRFNDTITELPIVFADGADLSEQKAVNISFYDGTGAFAIRSVFRELDEDGYGKVLRYGPTAKPQYYFDTALWHDDRYRYATFNNATATNLNNEDITQIFNEWLTANTKKQGQITFTIDGITYQADEGMCWRQWGASEYNTASYEVSFTISALVFKGDDYIATAVSDGTTDYRVKRSDVIIAGYSYALYNPDAPPPGLYDANGDLLADWDTLVNIYGMDIEKFYLGGTFDKETTSPGYVLTNNSELSAGVKMVIPNTVQKITTYSFEGITTLTSIVIPDNVIEITTGAFKSCINLTNIVIPNSVTDIGSFAFEYCTNLTDVYYRGTEEQWNAIKIREDNECLTNATIHYNYTG